MSAKPEEWELPIRIVVESPPVGVDFCVQGKTGSDLIGVTRAGKPGQDLAFDVSVRVVQPESGPPRFLGPVTQGPPSERFIYICIGTSAGDPFSCWTRRAKIPLKAIDNELLAQVRKAGPNARLEVRYPGTGKDGTPTCASVKLAPGSWKVVKK
jgi:hypothetical protein